MCFQASLRCRAGPVLALGGSNQAAVEPLSDKISLEVSEVEDKRSFHCHKKKDPFWGSILVLISYVVGFRGGVRLSRRDRLD